MVADCLNFTKAAEALKISQPAVSHQVRTLEDELGVKLFIRSNKRVMLTKEGMHFIGDALSILKIANASKLRLRGNLVSQPIHLGIGCHSTWELSLLPPLINLLSQEFAQFVPVLKLIPLPIMENLLEDESLQVMLSFRAEQEQRRHARYLELTKCPIVCVCAPEHPFAKCQSLTQEALHTGGGVFAEGYKADIILVDTQVPHMQPMYNALHNLVYAAQAGDVWMNMVNGRVLYQAGEYKTLDIEKVIAEAAKAAERWM